MRIARRRAAVAPCNPRHGQPWHPAHAARLVCEAATARRHRSRRALPLHRKVSQPPWNPLTRCLCLQAAGEAADIAAAAARKKGSMPKGNSATSTRGESLACMIARTHAAVSQTSSTHHCRRAAGACRAAHAHPPHAAAARVRRPCSRETAAVQQAGPPPTAAALSRSAGKAAVALRLRHTLYRQQVCANLLCVGVVCLRYAVLW